MTSAKVSPPPKFAGNVTEFTGDKVGKLIACM